MHVTALVAMGVAVATIRCCYGLRMEGEKEYRWRESRAASKTGSIN